MCSPISCVIGIATRGRYAVLAETLAQLRLQTQEVCETYVAFARDEDIGDLQVRFPQVSFLKCAPGLTNQRNAILHRCDRATFITFFDDDFWPDGKYLTWIVEVMRADPSIVIATGQVLADGINGPGLLPAQARTILLEAPTFIGSPHLRPVFNAYGCNMTLRLATIRKHNIRFDEQLPLYGWYEDVDLSRQLALYGKLVKVEQACGVHLGVKSGRQSGVRLGYSQIANPVYLAQKGSVSWSFALVSLTSRSMKNLLMSLRPAGLIDRRGRLMGNLQALLDLARGRLHPTRILGLAS